MASRFGKIRQRLRRRAARRPEIRPEARPEARPEEERETRLREILNNRIDTYERVMRDVIRVMYENNSRINITEAIALSYDCQKNITYLESARRGNSLDIVNAFPTEDGRDITGNYNNFLTRNGIDNQATNQQQVEAVGQQQGQEQVGNVQPNGGRAENNRPVNQVQAEAAGQQQRQGQVGIAQANEGRVETNQSTNQQQVEAPREQLRQEQVEIAQPDTGIARNSTQGDHRNSPRVASAQHDNAGRPEQGTATVEPNVMDNNANTDIYDSAQNYYRSGVINRFENAELPPTPHASESNSTGPADSLRVDSLNYNGAESGSSIQEEANVNELFSLYEDREADVNELISSYEDREEADVNDLVSSYQEQENVRDVTSENYSDRRVSSSFDSSIVSYDASNSLDTSTTSYDTRSSLGTSTTSYDRSSSLDSSYISYDRSSSLDSSYFSSDRSHNPESNTNTYNQISSDSSSDRRNSSQLVKNDSYQHTNNPNNQRRHSQSF